MELPREPQASGAGRSAACGGRRPHANFKDEGPGSEVLHGAAKRAASKRCWAQRGVRRVEAARQFHLLILLKRIEGQYFV